MSCILAITWGLDPVYSKWITSTGIAPSTLISTRLFISFLIFALLTAITFPKLKPYAFHFSQVVNKRAIVGGIVFFCVCAFSTFALTVSSPGIYNLLMGYVTLGLILISSPQSKSNKNQIAIITTYLVTSIVFTGLVFYPLPIFSSLCFLQQCSAFFYLILVLQFLQNEQQTLHICFLYRLFSNVSVS